MPCHLTWLKTLLTFSTAQVSRQTRSICGGTLITAAAGQHSPQLACSHHSANMCSIQPRCFNVSHAHEATPLQPYTEDTLTFLFGCCEASDICEVSFQPVKACHSCCASHAGRAMFPELRGAGHSVPCMPRGQRCHQLSSTDLQCYACCFESSSSWSLSPQLRLASHAGSCAASWHRQRRGERSVLHASSSSSPSLTVFPYHRALHDAASALWSTSMSPGNISLSTYICRLATVYVTGALYCSTWYNGRTLRRAHDILPCTVFSNPCIFERL